jgi:peptide/nickel transport system permease protein
MREYLLKRVLLIVPTLFLVTILVFFLMHMRSGDVVIQMLEGYAYADTVEALRRELGLDKRFPPTTVLDIRPA